MSRKLCGTMKDSKVNDLYSKQRPLIDRANSKLRERLQEISNDMDYTELYSDNEVRIDGWYNREQVATILEALIDLKDQFEEIK